MKILIKAFCVCLAVLASFSSFAGSGKAMIPYWSANSTSGSKTYINISNITDNDIAVTVTFYKKKWYIHFSN